MTSDPPIKLQCRNIWKVYGKHPEQFFNEGLSAVEDTSLTRARMLASGYIGAACNVNFNVREGEILVIMGLSGSGKSTIVRCLSRLIEPTAGEVLYNGRDLLKLNENELCDFRRHKMGMVFQHFGLLPHLTVQENIAFPLKIQGIGENQRNARAGEVIELVGLQGRENSFPRELSGGQQQRVGIARSLAVEPEIWFLDEPFSALDPLIRRQMQDEFLRLQEKLNKTIVFITHDFLEALRLADRIVIMKDGQVVQNGTPTELVLKPANDYVREFTQDVPRVRVLTAGEIAIASDEPDLPRIDAQCNLERAMPLLSRHPEGLAVEEAGRIIGKITPLVVVTALAEESNVRMG